MSDRPRLDSWKEIAEHFGRDVRTVLRWKERRGLPIYRVPGGARSRVFAYADELDEWLSRGSSEQDVPGTTRSADAGTPTAGSAQPWAFRPFAARMALAAAAVTLVAWGMWAWAQEPEAARQFAIEGSSLLALDRSGRPQWTHQFGSGELALPPARWTHVGDLDADGREDVLATVDVSGGSINQQEGRLVRFSRDGDVEWTSTIEDRLAFKGGDYGPPWAADDVSVYRAHGETRIAWIEHHFTWWPGLLVTLNAEGKRLGTFVNSGWIRTVRPSPDDRSLLITGMTNSRQSYFFAVLDTEHPIGQSPEPQGSAMECVNCPAGYPLQYYVFPRTDVSHQEPFPGIGPAVMTFEDGTAQVHVLDSPGPNTATTIYELSPELDILRARFTDAYWQWHRQLESEGKIDHPAAECPQRRGLEVQRWTPADGWRTIRVATF